MFLDFFKLIFGYRPACRFNKPGINSNPFIDGKPGLVKLLKKGAVDFDHGFFGKVLSESGKSAVIRRRVIHRQIKEGFKRNPVVNLAFKFGIGFDLKPFLEQHAFEQQQRGISSFSSVGFTRFIVFNKQCFNRMPVNDGIHLLQEN